MTENAHGRVSVIIAARDEEANIARAVRSVAAQQGVREILVVDDQSQDRTGEILESLKKEIAPLRTLRVELLPEGWVGKAHAAAEGAKFASGEWLLFTDADTEHLPGSLSALVERAEREQADLLSVSPAQETPTWWEKSVIPYVYVHLARLYRFEDVSDPASSAAAANGQYFLIRRPVYERVGGHEAVREEILEDVEIARRVKSSGGRLLFIPGAAWARTRMYSTFRAMWTGWTKNLYLLYGRRLRLIFGAVTRVLMLDLVPVLAFLVVSSTIALGLYDRVVILGALGLFLMTLYRQWNYSRELGRLGFDPSLATYQFIGAWLFALLLLQSVSAHRLRGRVQWKGRTYETRGTR